MSYNRETGMYEGYIYCITNQSNGKEYIGQTLKTLKERFERHKNCIKNNRYKQVIYYAFSKYGVDKFSIREIEKIICKTDESLRDELNKKEIFYIKDRNSMIPYGYNMSRGGQSKRPRRFSPAIVQYDLQGNKVNIYNSIMDASESTGFNRCNISECCKHMNRTVRGFVFRFINDDAIDIKNDLKTIIAQYDLDGNYLNNFETELDAAKSVNGYVSKISDVCLHPVNANTTRTAYGYRWMKYPYFENIPNKIESYKCALKKKVVVKDLDGNTIEKFFSIQEASIATHVSRVSIKDCCMGRKTSCKGYIYEYADGGAA